VRSAYLEKASYYEHRENSAHSALQRMGITLLRSGNKPGTKDKAYRLLFSDRMAINEVENFIARNGGRAKVNRRH
jgi:hypothetical protein